MNTKDTSQSASPSGTGTLPEGVVRDIKERLAKESDREIVAEDIHRGMSLREDLDLDSMQAVTLYLDLEDALSITLDEEDLTKLVTVGDLFDIVQERLS